MTIWLVSGWLLLRDTIVAERRPGAIPSGSSRAGREEVRWWGRDERRFCRADDRESAKPFPLPDVPADGDVLG